MQIGDLHLQTVGIPSHWPVDEQTSVPSPSTILWPALHLNCTNEFTVNLSPISSLPAGISGLPQLITRGKDRLISLEIWRLVLRFVELI